MRAAMTRRSNDGSNDDELDSPSEGIETGTLAIKSNENMKNEFIWLRPNRRRFTPMNSPKAYFEISKAKIMPPEGEDVTVKRYVIYDLIIHQQVEQRDPNPVLIERRYTDFAKLFLSLKSEHPQLMNNIYFPKKVLIGNFSTDLIAERSSAFESLLDYISGSTTLKDSKYFVSFLQDHELNKACMYLDERRNEVAVPILENCFRLLNKIFMDRSRPVLLLLCRLVAACTTSPVPHQSADKWAELALKRYEGVCDTELLVLYIPLLQTCSHLWWQRGRDKKLITERLNDMSKKGIQVTNGPSLTQALHSLDPRTETI
ncbi:sorting nexin-20 [Condylostylus longicornis]|uniref:sorting nexin-20 n=1 Tax=Condylostylus longicornis TaxID=2530218 RepID=UPI00244DD9A8|nr:sorting nexin-20 [Condylostylus longicornis]